MAIVSLYVATSIDGKIAGPNDDISWLPDPSADEFGYEAFLASVEALVMGARTYEVGVREGGWPYGDRDAYVFTSRHLQRAAPSVHLTAEKPAALVHRLRSTLQGRVWVVGGARVAGVLLDGGLVDEVVLTVVPVVLNQGIGLFDHVAKPLHLRLREARTLGESGAVQLTYGW